MKRLLCSTLLLTGCQTTMDPNFALQMESYRLTVTTQQNVEVAKARAEEARYNAIGAIAERGDPASRQMAILALALGRGSESSAHAVVPVQLPHIPENQEQRALKWAAIFAGPAISLVQGYFGYKLGVEQSRNTADSTIASYNALGTTALGGFSSNVGIANAGFGTVQSVANTGFGTIGSIATSAIASQTRPNFIVTNSGVIGSGSYTGPYSGTNSGNTGRINSPSDDHTNNSNCIPTPPAIVC